MMRPVRFFFLLTAVVAVVALAACGDDGDDGESQPSGTAAGSAGEVRIEDFMFQPESVEVTAGTTVTWTNRDQAAHTVKDRSSLGKAESERLGQRESYATTFDSPGTYAYICGIHQYMTGEVVVRA